MHDYVKVLESITEKDIDEFLREWDEFLQVCKSNDSSFYKALQIIIKLQAENAKLKERYKDYERLWEIADTDECDGNCDENAPFEKCPECAAGSAINRLGEIRNEELQAIERALKGERKKHGSENRQQT